MSSCEIRWGYVVTYGQVLLRLIRRGFFWICLTFSWDFLGEFFISLRILSQDTGFHDLPLDQLDVWWNIWLIFDFRVSLIIYNLRFYRKSEFLGHVSDMFDDHVMS